MSGLVLRLLRIAGYFAVTLPLMPVQAAFLALNSVQSRRFPHRYHNWVCRLIGIHLVRRGAVSSHRPTLFVANHTSYFDIEIMGAAIDESMRGKLSVAVIAASMSTVRKMAPPAPLVKTYPSHKPVEAAPSKPAVAVAAPATTAPAAPAVTAEPEAKQKKAPAKPKQETLPLEGITRGRFDKSEPTLYEGEDLDVPTFLRRGVSLKR